MKKITNLQIDTSEMPTITTSRKFTVNGEIGAKFVLYIVQATVDGSDNDVVKYYDFVDSAFELGHNNKDNNLEVTMSGKNYYGNIAFPSGGGTYTIKLLASSGTETSGSNKHLISKSITQQTSTPTLTFKAVTANTSNYATFPTTTTSGALTSQAKIEFDWDITNASTDSHGFGLILNTDLASRITGESWYFTTTETVDGAVSPTDGNGGFKVQVDDLTDIGTGSYISAVNSGSLVGVPYVVSIDIETKTLTLSVAQTFADGITLTFIAKGQKAIFYAIGSLITFDQYPIVTPTTLTKTVRADVSSSATITLNGTYGVAGNAEIAYVGVGVNSASSNEITGVTASSSAGSMTVELAQTLSAGTVLTFKECHAVINFKGGIKVQGYPSANKTIYLELDPFITVGAAS